MDPIKIYEIMNKKPREVVTSDEWNYAMTLLVTQGNYLSDQMMGLNQTIQDILDGKIDGIKIEANVTEFGGEPPEFYASKNDLRDASQTLGDTLRQEMEKFQSKITLTAGRAMITDSSGLPTASLVTATRLGYIASLTSDVQVQLNGKLSTTGTAANSTKIGGKTLFVQTSTPTATATGDVWISY